MKTQSFTEIRKRFGLLLNVFFGYLWYKNGGAGLVFFGLLGIALTLTYVVKRQRPVSLGALLGWGYWLLSGWKGEGVRSYMAHAAKLWRGDGSSLTSLFAFSIAMIYVVLSWKLAATTTDTIPFFKFLVQQTRRAHPSDCDWQPITFVLGEEKTQETFRLGGE